jgi:hypothetical protein
MNLVGSVGTLLDTSGSGLGMLVGWLCVLALAVVVFLVLIAMGVRSRGQSRRPPGPEQQGALWHQFFTARSERCRHERR